MSVFKGLKQAKGLGSGHNGTQHFIAMRIAGGFLIPLVLYFFYSVVRLVGAENYQAVEAWFANPLNMALASAFVIAGFVQAGLGLQVVIEDYVHHEKLKYLFLIIVKFNCFIGILIGIASILKLGL